MKSIKKFILKKKEEIKEEKRILEEMSLEDRIIYQISKDKCQGLLGLSIALVLFCIGMAGLYLSIFFQIYF